MEAKKYVENLKEILKKVGDMSDLNFDYLVVSDDPDCDADYGIDYNGNLVIDRTSTFLPVEELEHIRYRGTKEIYSKQDCYVSFVFRDDTILYAYFDDSSIPGMICELQYKGKRFSINTSKRLVTAINYGWNGKDEFVVTNDGTLIAYLGQEKNVVIPNGVTSIAESAFEDDSVETVVLADSVKSIGERAFLGTRGLKSIELKNVEVIKKDAFRASGLSNITLPATLKELGEEVFYYSYIRNKDCVDNRSEIEITDEMFKWNEV